MMIGIAIAIFAAIVGYASVKVFNMPADNPVEEAAEFVIEKETGMNIDLTPKGLEK